MISTPVGTVALVRAVQLFDAVTLAEYLECLDVCLGIVYQYAVHIEQDSPYHFVVF